MSSDKSTRLFEVNNVDRKMAELLISSYVSGENIVELSRITVGGSTSNYKLRTSDEFTYLLRVYPDENDHSEMEVSAYAYAEKLRL